MLKGDPEAMGCPDYIPGIAHHYGLSFREPSGQSSYWSLGLSLAGREPVDLVSPKFVLLESVSNIAGLKCC